MEIGLTAKVTPDVDERAAKREASAVREKIESAVKDLEMSVDISDVSDQVGDMKDQVENVSEHTEDAKENLSAMKDSVDGIDTNILEQMNTDGAFAQDVLFTQSPTGMGEDFTPPQQGGGLTGGISDIIGDLSEQFQGGFQKVTSAINEQTGSLIQSIIQQRSISAFLNNIGNLLSDKGGKVALVGAGLLLLAQIASSTVKNSPLLSTVVDMFGMAFGLFFRPFGNILGQFLLPIASDMLRLAAQFNTVFNNEGIRVALGWLAKELIKGFAETLVFGIDGELGIADWFRGLLAALFTKSLISGVLGTAVGKVFGNTLVTKILGFVISPLTSIIDVLAQKFLGFSPRQIVLDKLKNFGGVIKKRVSKALSPLRRLGTFVKSRISTALGSIRGAITRGFGSLFARLGSRVPGIGALLGRFIPSIGGKALLSKIGIGAITKALAGRVLYAIPFIGQLIGVIDLLTMAITFLLPGVETFSPVMYTLTKLFEGAVFLYKKTLGGLRALGNFLSGLSLSDFVPDISSEDVMGVFPSLTGISAQVNKSFSGGSERLNELLGDVTAALRFYIGPILETFEPVFKILGFFARKGIEFYNAIMKLSLGDIITFLKELKNKLVEFGGNIAGRAKEKLVNGAKELFDKVVDGAEDFKDDAIESAKDLKDRVVSGAKDLKNRVVSGAKDLQDKVVSGAKDLQDKVISGAKDLKNKIVNGANDLKNRVTDAASNLKDDIVQSAKDLKDRVVSGAKDLKTRVVDGAKDLKKRVVDGAKDLKTKVVNGASDLKDRVTQAASDLKSDVSQAATDFISDIGSSATNFLNKVNNAVGDFKTDVINSASNLKDDITNAASNLKGDITSAASDLASDVRNSASNLASDVRNSASDLASDVRNAASTLKSDVTSAASDFISDFTDINIGNRINVPNSIGIPEGIFDFPNIDIPEDIFDLPFNIDVPESRFDIPNIDIPDINVPGSSFSFSDIFVPSFNFEFPTLFISPSKFDIPEIDIPSFKFDIPSIRFEERGNSLIPDFFGSGGVVTETTNAIVGESGPEVIVPFDKVPGFTANILQGDAIGDAIPGLATGGIVTGPTTAVVGEGSESEAVLPLSRLESLLSTPTTPDMPGGSSIRLNVSGGDSEVLSGTDEDSLAQSIAEALASEFNDVSVGIDEVRSEVRRLRRKQNATITADGKVIAEISEKNKDRYTRSRNITR